MIKVYYASYTTSGRTAMNWLRENKISFIERKINKKNPLKVDEIKKMLELVDEGFDDLISKRAKKYKELVTEIYDYSTEKMIGTIIENPSLLKLPILMDEKRIVIGYNESEIRCFLSKEYRRIQLLKNGGRSL